MYDFFDSSFLLDDEKALIVLITAFEMVFLKKEKCKKEKLAKRSAIYFGNSNEKILYSFLEKWYTLIKKQKKRCFYDSNSRYYSEITSEDFKMVVMLIDRLTDKPSSMLTAARKKYVQTNPMTMEEID